MKKIISLALALALVISAVPLFAFADEKEVESISYKPIKDIVFYEYANGEWTNDHSDNSYYFYHTNFNSGDILTVNYTGNTSKQFTCIIGGDAVFKSDDGETLYSWQDVSIYHNQEEEKWQPNGKYQYFVEYAGKKAPVDVTVLENPVVSIEYYPVEQLKLYFETDGHFDIDDEAIEYFKYDVWKINTGDMLRVNYTDRTVEYTCTFDNTFKMMFIADGEEPIDCNSIQFESNQAENHYEIGDNNEYRVSYMGKSYTLYASVIENPVKEIRYETANPVVYYEGDTRYDELDNRDYYNGPTFEDGDRLIVVDKEDHEKVYTYDKLSMVFMSNDSDIIQYSQVKMHSNQHDTPWQLGDNPYTVEYLGKLYTLYAKVVENPVKAIEYTPNNSLHIFEGDSQFTDYHDGEEYLRYNYPMYENGDKLTIITKDDKRIEYTIVEDPENHDRFFESETGDRIDCDKVNIFDEQYNKPWVIGNENEYYVKYMGKIFTLYATIEENPVKAIKYIPLYKPVVYKGINCYDFDGITVYREPGIKQGDKFIITDKNDNEIVFTAVRDDRNDLIFVNENHPEINAYEV